MNTFSILIGSKEIPLFSPSFCVFFITDTILPTVKIYLREFLMGTARAADTSDNDTLRLLVTLLFKTVIEDYTQHREQQRQPFCCHLFMACFSFL